MGWNEGGENSAWLPKNKAGYGAPGEAQCAKATWALELTFLLAARAPTFGGSRDVFCTTEGIEMFQAEERIPLFWSLHDPAPLSPASHVLWAPRNGSVPTFPGLSNAYSQANSTGAGTAEWKEVHRQLSIVVAAVEGAAATLKPVADL